MTESMAGKVENGSRVLVKFGEFEGMAGVRTQDEGREVAFYGPKIKTFPIEGTIGGEPATAVALIKSPIVGFCVLWVPDQ